MKFLRLGTRGSPLSLRQAFMAESFLRQRLGTEFSRFSLVKITTSGDRILDKPLYEIGGKGLFTKELDHALLDRRIDLAVHSAKDIESILPSGLVIAAYLPRGDRRDCLLTSHELARDDGDGIACLLRLPKSARLGTASPRRSSLVRLLRDDLEITLLRGNIERRLSSLSSGANDAIILASCALERLGKDVDKGMGNGIALSKLDEHSFVSAAGQGAIAIVVREADEELRENLRTASDFDCQVEVAAERAFLRAIGGSCHTPLGASARLQSPLQSHLQNPGRDKISDSSCNTPVELSLCAFVIENGRKKQLQLNETINETINKDTGKTNSAFSLQQAEALGARMAHELSSLRSAGEAGSASEVSLASEAGLARL